MTEYYIARDKDGLLWLFGSEPVKNEIDGIFMVNRNENGEWPEEYELKKEMFPEVTFENSPQRIELKLVNK